MKVEYYSDIQTAPIERFVKFNSLLSMQQDVGSTFEDLQKRDRSAIEFLKAGNVDSALKELSNKMLAKHFLKEEFCPIGHALACMVKSIDGEPRDDLSEQGLDATLKKLSDLGVSYAKTKQQAEDLKKKSTSNLKFSFLGFLKKMSIKLLT